MLTLANVFLKTTPLAGLINTKQDKDFKTFTNEGILSTTVTYSGWNCDEACLTVVEDGHKLIIKGDLFNSLGLAGAKQQAKRGKCVNKIVYSTFTLMQTMTS